MLKYLFKALLNTGEVIEQTQEDKSTTSEGKNAFYDVLQNFDKLIAFSLFNQETGEEFMVDLRNGRFEVNGGSFYMHDESISNIRLIFFKRTKITTNLADTPLYETEFHFGFQANLPSGENVKRVMVLS